MKKLVVALLTCGLMLSLAACGGNEDIGTFEPDPAFEDVEDPVDEPVNDVSEDVSVDVSDDVSEPVEAGEGDYIADFYNAQEVFYRFDSGFECDYNDSVLGEIGGYETEFYRVTEPGFSSVDDIKAMLETVVTEDVADFLISSNDRYLDHDGALYSCPAGRGDDLTIAWVELESEADKVIVKVHRNNYFDYLQEWYENGVVDTYEFPFTVVDGHAIFSDMFYLCGWAPVTAPEPGHDGDALETALIGLIAGTWVNNTDGDQYTIEIGMDGSYTYCSGSDVMNSGQIFSSRNDDYTYMMENDETSNTMFSYGIDEHDLPILVFENGSLIFELVGQG